MEILRFLISFFLKEYGGEKFAPLMNELSKNNFDLKSFLKNINLESIAPIISALFQNAKNRPTESAERNYSLAPIAGIADKDIVYTLNKYFYSNSD